MRQNCPMQIQAQLAAIRAALAVHADAEHARFHQAYHKSAQRFYGLRTPQLQAVWRELWPARGRLLRAEVLSLLQPLWNAGCHEESQTAIHLLSRITHQLTPDDLPLLHTQTRRCTGWAQLDTLAATVLGPLALVHGAPVYAPVMHWLDDEWLWTRRAAVLIHIVPARKRLLAEDYAWTACAARLDEKEFFIRKAIGWTLREFSKHYAGQVAGFAREHRQRMSGLTFREATRNLPPELSAGL
jgi:3-methyladenine DNA glycosylase AlkD